MVAAWAMAAAAAAGATATLADAYRPLPPLEGHGAGGMGFKVARLAALDRPADVDGLSQMSGEALTELGGAGESVSLAGAVSEPFSAWLARAAQEAARVELPDDEVEAVADPDVFPLSAVQRFVRGDRFCVATVITNSLVLTSRRCLGVSANNSLPDDFFGTAYLAIGEPGSPRFSYRAAFGRALWSSPSEDYAVLQLYDPDVSAALGALSVSWTTNIAFSIYGNVSVSLATFGSRPAATTEVDGFFRTELDCTASRHGPGAHGYQLVHDCASTEVATGSPLLNTAWYSCEPDAVCGREPCTSCKVVAANRALLQGMTSAFDASAGRSTFRSNSRMYDAVLHAAANWEPLGGTSVPPANGEQGDQRDEYDDEKDAELERDVRQEAQRRRDILVACFVVAVILAAGAVALAAFYLARGRLPYLFGAKPSCARRAPPTQAPDVEDRGREDPPRIPDEPAQRPGTPEGELESKPATESSPHENPNAALTTA